MGYNDSLVSRWDMSTINPPDLGFRRHGNDGVGTGLVAATDIVQGRHGKSMAVEFNGVDEYIDVADHASLNFTAGQDLSYGCWFRWITDNTDTQQPMMSKRSASVSPYQGYELYGRAGGTIRATVRDLAALTSQATSPGTYDDNMWHHGFAVFVSGVSVPLYIDGAPVDQYVVSPASGDLTNALPLRFGGGADWLPWVYPGVVDDARLYNIALTNLQVTDLYVASRQGRL